jgi:hypothetical protein
MDTTHAAGQDRATLPLMRTARAEEYTPGRRRRPPGPPELRRGRPGPIDRGPPGYQIVQPGSHPESLENCPAINSAP